MLTTLGQHRLFLENRCCAVDKLKTWITSSSRALTPYRFSFLLPPEHRLQQIARDYNHIVVSYDCHWNPIVTTTTLLSATTGRYSSFLVSLRVASSCHSRSASCLHSFSLHLDSVFFAFYKDIVVVGLCFFGWGTGLCYLVDRK